MLKFLQNSRTKDASLSRALSVGFGSAALIALMATPVAPALAQGVPAGLLRLDPPQPSNDGAKQLTEDQRVKLRSAYAHSRKTQVNQ
jgi:hypothetical protein